jgi:hypothetical protein
LPDAELEELMNYCENKLEHATSNDPGLITTATELLFKIRSETTRRRRQHAVEMFLKR